MSAVLLLLAAAASPPAVTVDPPDRVAVYLSLADRYKNGEFALVDRFERLLKPTRTLEVERRSSAELRDCAESLRCLVSSLRTANPPVRFVVLLSMSEAAGGALTSLLMLDVGRALEVLASDLPEAEAELAIAKLLRPDLSKPIVARDFAAVFDHIERTYSSAYFEPLRTHAGDFGLVELRLPRPGLDLAIDGRGVGVANGPIVRLERVRGGARRLEVVAADGKRFETVANVTPRTVTTVEVRPEIFDETTPPAIYIGSAAVAVVGVAMIVAHFIRAAGANDSVCFMAPGRDCDGFVFITSKGARVIEDEPRAPTLRLFPLGYSLVGASAVTAGSAWWLDAEDAWWAPLIGLAAGALTYSLGIVLD